jgi:hypothetical protein
MSLDRVVDIHTASREDLIALIEEYRELVVQAWQGMVPHEGCQIAYADWLEAQEGYELGPNVVRAHDRAVAQFLDGCVIGPGRENSSLWEKAEFFGWQFIGTRPP